MPAAEPGSASSKSAQALRAAVVVCAYTGRRWDLLVEGVGAILAQTPAPDRVILVIDHNDELLESARQRFSEGVEVVPNTSQPGLSGARNTGIGLAEEDVVVFVDDDAVPEPGWLAALMSAYGGDVLGVGGAIQPRWATARPGWFPAEFDWVIGCTYRGMPESPGSVRNLIGANMSLRREVFERVGGFRDELARIGTLPFGCEETELCIRARQSMPGGVFWYEPAARVHHWVSRDRTRFSYFRKQCFNEGRGKALIAGFVGAQDGLSSERSYALRVLPAGILGSLQATSRDRDAAGVLRAGAIVVGLLSAAAGYFATRLRERLA
jgi:GT2 family glycosyltransferase